MSKLIPFFEIDGKRYEIRPTTYLAKEYNKIGENSTLSEEQQIDAIKFQELANEVRELAEHYSVIKEKHFADFANKELTAEYKAVRVEYKEAIAELAEFEVRNESSRILQKATIDALEQLAIKGLAEQYFDYGKDNKFCPEILEKGKELWCNFVDSVNSKDLVSEWLIAMADCLFNAEKEVKDNSFLGIVRAKQNKAQAKK